MLERSANLDLDQESMKIDHKMNSAIAVTWLLPPIVLHSIRKFGDNILHYTILLRDVINFDPAASDILHF